MTPSADSSAGLLHRWRPLPWAHLGVLLLFLGLSWFTCFGRGEGLLRGSYGGTLDRDAGTFVYYFWHLKEAVLGRADLYWSDHMFYPLGFNLILQDWSPVVGMMALPFQSLGPIGAFNLQLLFAFALTGFFTYLLVYTLCRHRAMALLAGLLFAFCEFRVFKAFVHGQPSQAHQEFIPLYLLFVILFLSRARWRHALGAGICFFLATFTSPYQMVFLLLATPFFFFFFLHRRVAGEGLKSGLKAGGRRLVGFCIIAGGAALLLATPVIHANWEAVLRGAPSLGAAKLPFTDVFAFVQPFIPERLFFLEETKCVFLGYSALALLLPAVFCWRRGTGAMPWLVLALFFFLVSLGSHLTVDEQRLFPLPFFPLLQEVPVIQGARTASRYASMVMLGVAVAVALTLAHLERAYLARCPRWLLLPLHLTLLLVAGWELIHHRFEATWPREQVPVPMPMTEVNQVLARQPGTFTVLPFPLIWETANLKIGPHYFARDNFVQHTLHGKRTISGMGDAVPPATIDYFRDLPLLSELFWIGEGIDMPDPGPPQRAEARYLVSFFDIRYVLVQRAMLGPEPHHERARRAVARLGKLLQVQEVYRDVETLLLKVIQPPDREGALTRRVDMSRRSARAHLGQGWRRVNPEGFWLASANLDPPGPGDILFRRRQQGALTLELWQRCTKTAGEQTVLLNGEAVARLEVGRQWQRQRVSLPARAVRAGMNRLRLATAPRERAEGAQLQVRSLSFKKPLAVGRGP